jgi:DNA-binding transcriptional LysR family regulator
VHEAAVNKPDVRSFLTVNSAEASIAACAAGLGIIQIPAYDVSGLLATGVLYELMPEFRPRPMPVSILYPHRRHLSRHVRLFADWLTPLLQEKMCLKD